MTAAEVRPLVAADAARGERDTDMGNSERLVERHGQMIRYSHTQGRWLIWNGKCWQPDTDGAILRLTDDVVKSLHVEAGGQDNADVRRRLAMHARASEALARRRAMVDGAQHLVPVKSDDLDAHPYLLNVDNGVLNLRTGELSKHDPALLLTTVTPAAYDPEAQAPTWIKFLDRVLAGDADLIAYVQRCIGYCLTGDVSEHVMFLPYGTGANGKSTLLDVVQALLGDLAKTADPSVLLSGKRDSGAATPGLAMLRGARAAMASEINEGNRLDAALIKWVTGGERILARFLHRDPFEYRPQFKLWLAVNHRPEITDTTEGMWRRLHLIPFTVTIPKDERDGGLKDRLLAELPGILAWAVQGCLAWQQRGLDAPEVVREATAEYRADQDAVGAFLATRCEFGPTCRQSATGLHNAYLAWAKAEGQELLGLRQFGARVREHGHRSGKSGGYTTWIGVMANSDYTQGAEQ